MGILINRTLSNLYKPFFSVILLANTACSPVKLLNAVISDSNYSITTDIAFGALSRQKLDIYTPLLKVDKSQNNVETVKRLKKVIIFYYGGNWDSGEKADYKFAAEALTASGHIVVIPNYRVYPEVLFPEFMIDPALIAKWVKTNIHEYGGDASQIFLSGHSAGAYIAVMMAVNPEYLAAVSLKPNDFAGIIGLAGPYDFLPLGSDRLKTIFGNDEQQVKSQPINFVDGKNPPLLLVVGLKDNTVWPRNSYNIAKKINANGGKVKVIEFADYGHVDMVAKLAKPLRGNGDLLKIINDFIEFNRVENKIIEIDVKSIKQNYP